MKLEGRTALVTGAGSGIGRAIALRFAEEGARVAVNDLRLESAQETVKAMGPRKGQGSSTAADVSNSSQVRAMFAEVEKEFGGLDVLVNNAGITATKEKWVIINRKYEASFAHLASGQKREPLDFTVETTDEEWLEMLAVHLNGTFFCTREALKVMSRKNGGSIINISSVAALMGGVGLVAYSAAKGGILSFTRAVARDVATRNIRVNAICPGWVDTPMTQPMQAGLKAAVTAGIPMFRFGEAPEVAATALFLASDDSSYFTGQWLSPNGGSFIG